MRNSTNNVRLYHGKQSLFTSNLSIWSLYTYLQRTTGFPLYNCAFVPIKLLSHQFQAIMRNCTNDVKLYHQKQSLFTRSILICSLYAYFQTTTGFPLYNCAFVPIKLLSHQFQAIMRNCTNNVKLYHGKQSLFTRNILICSLYAYFQRTTGFPLYNCAIVPIQLFRHQFSAIMGNCTNNVKLYHGKQSLFTRNILICIEQLGFPSTIVHLYP